MGPNDRSAGAPLFLEVIRDSSSASVITLGGTPGVSDEGEYQLIWTAPLSVAAPLTAGGSASSPIDFLVTASDSDGEPVYIEAEGLPPGATFSADGTSGGRTMDFSRAPKVRAPVGPYPALAPASSCVVRKYRPPLPC